MKIKYLGTAAAEGVPAFFCKCEVCQNAILKKGKEIRTRSQALINDDLLIDFGPDSYFHFVFQNVPLADIEHILITHSHSDHLQVDELSFIKKGYAAIVKNEKVKVYGNGSSYNMVKNMIESNDCDDRMEAIEVIPYHTYKVGNYMVSPIRANHDVTSSPVNYVIDDGKKIILYAHDTGVFFDESIDFLKKLGKKLDLISLDCTAGLLTLWKDHHLSYDCFLEEINRLKEQNIIDNNTKIIANHFSHNGKASYEKMQEVAKKDNIIVSYDGLEIEI